MQLLKRRHKFTSQPNKRGPKNEKPRGKSRRRKSQGMRWHPFRSSWPQCWPQNAKPQKGAKCKSGKALHVIVNKFDCNGLEKSGGGKSVWQRGGESIHKMDLAVCLPFASVLDAFFIDFPLPAFFACAHITHTPRVQRKPAN